MKTLIEAAQAVVDRWDSPLWKNLPHTGKCVDELREAIATTVVSSPVRYASDKAINDLYDLANTLVHREFGVYNQSDNEILHKFHHLASPASVRELITELFESQKDLYDMTCKNAQYRGALIEVLEQIKDHSANASLTEEEENDVGGDTAEFSYLTRLINDVIQGDVNSLSERLQDADAALLQMVLANHELKQRIASLEAAKTPTLYVQTNHLDKLKHIHVDFVRVSKNPVSGIAMTPLYEK